MPKETGLMFKAPLVRAILSGQKTQTRRMVNPQPHEDRMHQSVDPPTRGSAGEWTWWAGNHTQGIYHSAKCPFGKPGDRIYVRETFANHPKFPQIAFRADGEEFEDADGWLWEPKWTPCLLMPKTAARIWLEITGVRVERLQDISEADASREGLQYSTERMGHWCGNGKDWQMTPRQAFRDLWVSTGSDWAANPWVWVIDFKRIDKP